MLVSSSSSMCSTAGSVLEVRAVSWAMRSALRCAMASFFWLHVSMLALRPRIVVCASMIPWWNFAIRLSSAFSDSSCFCSSRVRRVASGTDSGCGSSSAASKASTAANRSLRLTTSGCMSAGPELQKRIHALISACSFLSSEKLFLGTDESGSAPSDLGSDTTKTGGGGRSLVSAAAILSQKCC